MDQETKEIFEKMDRQEELRMRLSNAIPDLFIVDHWKTYVNYLKRAHKSLTEALAQITRQNTGRDVLIVTEREARYHLFNFYSCVYCIRQTMFEGKHFQKGGVQFDFVVTGWKKEFVPRIAIAVDSQIVPYGI